MSGLLSGISAFFQSIALGLGLIHDANVRTGQKAADNAADLKGANDVAAKELDAANNTTDADVLDELNHGRF